MGGTRWLAAAEQLTPVGASGTMTGGQPRVVWHSTESPSGKSSAGRDYFDLMHRVLVGKSAEPHVLWDPATDRMGQYFPLDRSARALRNADGGVETNRMGTVCIQIEVVAYAGNPFTRYWRPGPNFRALMAAIRSWGIPDEWPAGAMSRAGEDVSRSVATWQARAGHYGHCHVPENTHWDCGAIDQRALFAVSNPVPTPPEARHMKVIQSPGRGSALVGAAYFLPLNTDEDKAQAAKLWGAPVIGNDRQFDLWRAQALAGITADQTELEALQATPGRVVTTGVDVDALADKIADRLAARLAN